MASRNVIVLSIDGLRASALGCYGGPRTPAFDQLASESLLVEWALADCQSPAELLAAISANDAFPPSSIVTDDQALLESAAAESFETAILVEVANPSTPAASLGDAWLADTFAAFFDAVAPSQAERAAPQILWLHTRGLTGAWDAPLATIEEMLGEDDPQPEADATPPSGPLDREQTPDAFFLANCRYMAQVALLDACIAGLLDAIDELNNTPPAIVVLGAGGYALGEHGVTGAGGQTPYSESRHVPLIVRGDASAVGVRHGASLFGLSQLSSLIHSLAEGDGHDAVESIIEAIARPSAPLAGSQRSGVRTLDWLCVEPTDSAPAELYAKPDDRWEANDIASLMPDVVDELLASNASGRR